MGVPTVLLVTHVADERAIYGESLHAQGFNVRMAEGPDDAFAMATREPPDIIVTRILQPGYTANGIDLLRRLKQHDLTARIPVIIITSLMQPDYREQAMEAGCDGYLLLPALPDLFVAEVRHVLSKHRRSIA
jgi:two-component system cell cycle response regulator DivK